MSLMDMLYHTYECAMKVNDADFTENYPLFHTKIKAPIVVWISENAEFQHAGYIEDKSRMEINVPCTEKSAGRSGTNPVPHPLFDKLSYLAGDGELFGVDNGGKFESYIRELQAWCDSNAANSYVDTIFRYLSKKRLLTDLYAAGLIRNEKDLKKRLDEGVRIGIGRNINTDLEVWNDESVRKDFARYVRRTQENEEFCYISGEYGKISENHPKSIWNLHANAKLISANEKPNRGLVYSGRFENPLQAAQVSYEASLKIHNTLKWLINKQGKYVGDKMLLAWGLSGDDESYLIGDSDGFNDDEEVSSGLDTQADFARRFHDSILKKKANLYNNEKIGVLLLEAATPGRLSVSYYQEFSSTQIAELIDNVEKWHINHAWYQMYDKEKRKMTISAPSVIVITLFCEGVERSGKMDVDDKVFGNTVIRLLPCVLEGKAIPEDILQKLVFKTLRPMNYSEQNWHRLLKITCSLLREKYKEVGTMDVNRDSTDIHYNYGRWLAVAHEIERRALWQNEVSRETNAMRLFSKYAENPNKYMAVIQSKIQIYEEKLGEKGNALFHLKNKISAKLLNNSLDELQAVRNLDGRMVLGFEAQLDEFINRKDNNESKETEEKK